MTAFDSFLADLSAAASHADMAERSFRAEMETRASALAHTRAEAFRRANFMRTVTEAVAGADSAQSAANAANAHLRARFDWTELSPAREEVLSRFEAVAAALHRCEAGAPEATQEPAAPTVSTAEGETMHVPARTEDAPPPEVALASFEAWYFETRQSSFWHLFEHYMPETPRVDY